MTHNAQWNPYGGSGSIILAVVLLLITGVLIGSGLRLHHRIEVKRPGIFISLALVGIWILSVLTFLVAVTMYGLADKNQGIRFTGPTNPIAPVSFISGVFAFLVIVYLARLRGPWIAIVSAIVGTLAAPLIFELPFDLIVMWRTFPPDPGVAYTLLYFLPLFLIEIISFMMLTFSPIMNLSRYSLFLLGGMFFVFAVWALFGFGFPSSPLPVVFNVISKILAFATAVSLFLPAKKSEQLLVS